MASAFLPQSEAAQAMPMDKLEEALPSEEEVGIAPRTSRLSLRSLAAVFGLTAAALLALAVLPRSPATLGSDGTQLRKLSQKECHIKEASASMALVCKDCTECGWDGADKINRDSLGGGGHSESACQAACIKSSDCSYAARSNTGYCHLFATCKAKQGNGWTRWAKSQDGEECPMSAMPHDGNDYVNVYPGGHTACLESWSPFSFQVWPGDTDKLAIYFQAGGLCFDKRTTVERLSTGGMFERGLCTQSVGAQGARGMFNKSEKRNPWRHFTILHINYCSGDGHVGNGSRWYCEGSNCTEYQSRGYINARAAIDWVKAQMDRNLQYFSVSGSSAGAIGTYVWANPLLKEFSSDGWSYQHGSVVVDSFAAVTPEGTVAPLLKSFGLCNTSLLSEKARGACKKGGDVQLISVADSFMEGMAAYPSVWFGFISSKVDSVQKMYYQSVAVAYGKYWDAMISKQKFYRKLNTLLEDYSKHPNFVAYLIDGSQHTFLGMQYDFKYSMLCNFYKVGTTGIYEGSSGSKQGTSQLLYEWGEHFAAFNSPPKTQCSGSVVDVSEWKKKDFTDVTYCDAALLQ